MSTSTHQPTFLAVEERGGQPTLGGRRQFLDTFDAEVAEELRLFALEPVEVVDIVPVSASAHICLIDVPALDPEPRVIAMMVCPCGARYEMYEGATDQDWEAWYRDTDAHEACQAEVA